MKQIIETITEEEKKKENRTYKIVLSSMFIITSVTLVVLKFLGIISMPWILALTSIFWLPILTFILFGLVLIIPFLAVALIAKISGGIKK